MNYRSSILKIPLTVVAFFSLYAAGFSQPAHVSNNPQARTIEFGNNKIRVTLSYDHQACLKLLSVDGRRVIDDSAGVYSSIRTAAATYSTLHLKSNPGISTSANSVTVSNINFGDGQLTITEKWTFTISSSNIRWQIERSQSKPAIVEQSASPVFLFNNINTWDGAYQDYGGLAWFYLFNKKLDTYGVYSKSSRFWNTHNGSGLTISVDAGNRQVAMTYSRTANDRLAYTVATSATDIIPRFDSGTQRRLFLRDRDDVWDAIKTPAGKTVENITLSYVDVQKEYDRGHFEGLKGDQISAVLNTIARIGVIGKNHFGGNSWHTPYGPLCLHEQYIAQMGVGIDDPYYLKGYQECLDFYRDNAVKPDGRVWPRWAYTNEDMMPGEVTPKGFYEAQWGYLLDSNPDFVTNISELFDQTGDTAWVRRHRITCEKALDWILKRDDNKNGLVEMIPANHAEGKSSDWIDIIWASYENAFVNAKLYRALTLWAGVESVLGETKMEKYYTACAETLRKSFNKPVGDGGFWDDEKKCYIHWRDKDGSPHGNNMVTPVNFMAIAYGICDDSLRTRAILDAVETQMQKEKLFFWPICLYSYAPGEGKDWQFPFPNYENGDLFLSWGSIAVEAYASYKPELAVKYVRNVLDQYAKDGLAFQRYGRAKQDGRGDDILSGNSLAIVGLYRSIYGINPMHNRFYLQPHITPDLAGTKLFYNFRNSRLTIALDSVGKYSVSDNRFTISARRDFGFFHVGNELHFFNGDSNRPSLKAATPSDVHLSVEAFEKDDMSWTQSSRKAGEVSYTVPGLQKSAKYKVVIAGKPPRQITSDNAGVLRFNAAVTSTTTQVIVQPSRF